MYQVSNAFLDAMKSPVQEHTITGTIGSVSFDEENIVDGSFSISNQSTDTSDVVLGSCYVGQLTAEFVGINIAYGKWINKTITLSFGLKVGEYYEYVPLGVYKVKEAKHTDHGVQVVAYDNMIKFDKKFKKSHFMNVSGMTNIIDQLCLDAGVICGMSHAEIEALPNGDRTGINIYGSTGKKAEFANDITTLRDLLFWVAQTLGCFATINRAGQLEFRPYNQNVVDQITEQHRIAGATFADYITHYVGIYVENLDDNTEDYYGYDTTALTQELQETMSEITEDQEDITDLELDRADWVQKLANHECTQQEYDAAIAEIDAQEKALTKEINQLSKRAEWLSNAVAQSADDGSDMVLGANPFVMAKNLTTRDAQRREILGALNAISYTPFQASVVCGCIYDLGDVIQFSGGLYNSDTDSFGCVMSYTYTHNGGTELEGFGVDPSVVVIRNKTQKSTDRASKNAVNAKESFNGFSDPQEEFPSGGKDGDIYIKRKVERTPKITIVNNDEIWSQYGGFPVYDSTYKVHQVLVDRDTGKYSISAYGDCYLKLPPGGNINDGCPLLELHGFSDLGTYRFHLKANYTAEYIDGWMNTGNQELGIAVNPVKNSIPPNVAIGTFVPTQSPAGIALNVELAQNTYIEYTCDFTINQNIKNQMTDDILYVKFTHIRCVEKWNVEHFLRFNIQDFYVEYLDSSEPWYEESEYIEDVYTYIKDDDETEQGQDTGHWEKIDYLAGADTSSWSGLSVDYKKILSLRDYVMRAWYKADPPQVSRDFSQFCVRYTGKPDTGITISYHGASGWEGQELKVSDEGIYAIKCGGTRTSGVDYVAYKIEGLVSGSRYYFNFAANIGNSATFGDDFTKGLGLIFNASGSINSNDWSGDPHTFDDSTLYESFYRNTGKRYYDFDFVATASTMYMIVTVADIDEGITTVLNLTEFVISQEERKYIREFYLYDFHVNEWLKYKPFGTKDDGSAEGVTHLSELDDVLLDDLQNGQILEYDEASGKWINSDNSGGTDDYSDLENKPTINSITLFGNKTSSDLGVVITLTQAQYDALPIAEKTDPNKVYYISDAGGGGGGTGAEVLSDLDDVQISSLSGGQILKYDSSLQKWVNGAEYSYTLPVASANILGGIKVGQNLSIDQDGTLNATGGGASDIDDLGDVDISSPSDGQVLKYNISTQKWENQNEGGGYTLPTASDTTKGGVKVGNGLEILNEFLSVNCGNGLKVDSNGAVAINPDGISSVSNPLYTSGNFTFSNPVSSGNDEPFRIDMPKEDFVYGDVTGKIVINQGIRIFAYDANDNQYNAIIVQATAENTISNDKEIVRINGNFYNTTGVTIVKLKCYLYYVLL